MKKRNIAFLGVGLLLFAALVYAWSTDSDGGYAPFVKGTCHDDRNATNFTDYCYNSNTLVEYVGGGSWQVCWSTGVSCPSYNHNETINGTACYYSYTCNNGKCKEYRECQY